VSAQKDSATLKRLSVTVEVNSSTSAATEGLELCREQRVPWEWECLELLDLWGARTEAVAPKGNSDTACEVTTVGIGGGAPGVTCLSQSWTLECGDGQLSVYTIDGRERVRDVVEDREGRRCSWIMDASWLVYLNVGPWWRKSRNLEDWSVWLKVKVTSKVSRGRLTWTCSGWRQTKVYRTFRPAWMGTWTRVSSPRSANNCQENISLVQILQQRTIEICCKMIQLPYQWTPEANHSVSSTKRSFISALRCPAFACVFDSVPA